MGLTIHYTLRSKCRSASSVLLKVEALRQRALDLPFQHVGHLIEIQGEACDFEARSAHDPQRWLLIQATEHVSSGDYSYSVPPSHVIAFVTTPGNGCEPANFGLCRYPATVSDQRGGQVRTGLTGWRWRSFCKTQCASNPKYGGIQNFLRCHLSVIRLLDHAKELGLLDEVSDEGDYFEKRQMGTLAREVVDWNEMIAAFVGQVDDWVGNRESAKSEIQKFPDFEHLEARGRNRK